MKSIDGITELTLLYSGVTQVRKQTFSAFLSLSGGEKQQCSITAYVTHTVCYEFL